MTVRSATQRVPRLLAGLTVGLLAGFLASLLRPRPVTPYAGSTRPPGGNGHTDGTSTP